MTKTIKKSLFIIVAVLFLSAFLVACGDKDKKEDTKDNPIVTIDTKSKTVLQQGESIEWIVSVSPDDKVDIEWSIDDGDASLVELTPSADTHSVTITTGQKKPTSDTKVKLKAQIVDTTYFDTEELTVKPDPAPEVTLTASQSSLKFDETTKISATVANSPDGKVEYEWSSSSPTVLDVTPDIDTNEMTTMPAALVMLDTEVEFEAIAKLDGTEIARGKIAITVLPHQIESVTIDNSDTTIRQGNTLQLSATVDGPVGIDPQDVNLAVDWTVDGDSGASIDQDGLLTVSNTVDIDKTLTIKATSVATPSKFDQLVLTVQVPASQEVVFDNTTTPSSVMIDKATIVIAANFVDPDGKYTVDAWQIDSSDPTVLFIYPQQQNPNTPNMVVASVGKIGASTITAQVTTTTGQTFSATKVITVKAGDATVENYLSKHGHLNDIEVGNSPNTVEFRLQILQAKFDYYALMGKPQADNQIVMDTYAHANQLIEDTFSSTALQFINQNYQGQWSLSYINFVLQNNPTNEQKQDIQDALAWFYQELEINNNIGGIDQEALQQLLKQLQP